jgi:hypothetical protein
MPRTKGIVVISRLLRRCERYQAAGTRTSLSLSSFGPINSSFCGRFLERTCKRKLPTVPYGHKADLKAEDCAG